MSGSRGPGTWGRVPKLKNSGHDGDPDAMKMGSWEIGDAHVLDSMSRRWEVKGQNRAVGYTRLQEVGYTRGRVCVFILLGFPWRREGLSSQSSVPEIHKQLN